MSKIDTLKSLRIWAAETAPEARPEDIDFLLAERLELNPSEFQLKQDLQVTPDQVKQAQKTLKSWLKEFHPNIFWATRGF